MAKDILILGGGIAGLETALKLERKIDSKHSIKLIEPRDALLFYPASHKIMEGDSADEITINYSEKFENRNIKHLKDTAIEIQTENQSIKTSDNGEINYDYLVVSLGAEANYHGLEKKNTETLRYKEDLVKIREMISSNEAENITVVGGGPTGVEAAAALKEARKKDKEKDFTIRLFHSQGRLLPRQSPKLGNKAEKELKKENVEIHLNTKIKGIEPHCVCTEDGKEYMTDEVIWAGGIQKHQLIEKTENLPQNSKGIKVNQHQQAEHFQNIYAVGDCASYQESKARALYALFEAKTAAKNITKQINSKSKLSTRNIPYDPIIIYLGEDTSAIQFKNLVFSGRLPNLMEKIGVEKRYMWIRKKLL